MNKSRERTDPSNIQMHELAKEIMEDLKDKNYGLAEEKIEILWKRLVFFENSQK